MNDYITSDLDLWRFSGNCSIHGGYIYYVKKNESSVGCPVCSVKTLEAKNELLTKEISLLSSKNK